jgi:hypothetical protein
VSETVIVKTRSGLVRSMTREEHEALRERAVANAVPVSRQLDAEEAERS